MIKITSREADFLTNKSGITDMPMINESKRTMGFYADYIKKFPGRIILIIMSVIFTGFVLCSACMAFISMGETIPDAPQTAAVYPAAPVSSSADMPAPAGTSMHNFIEISGRYKYDPKPEPIGMPNIYFFILDEYGSFDMLSKYYGYDNKVFSDFLETKGFNISRVSYATDNETEHCICDLLNLNYISRHYSGSQCYDALSKAKTFSVLSDLGYSQFQISTSNKPFNGIVSLSSKAGKSALKAVTERAKGTGIVPGSSGSEAFSEMLKSSDGDTSVDSAALNEWGFYPSDYIRNTKAFKNDAYRSHANSILNVFDYYENPSNYPVTTPRVTYSYILAAHVPFVFDEYGGMIPSGESRDWRDTSVYLDQYKFITKHMMATVSTIINNDPDSIIIVMSDHGIRYHADCTLAHKFYITDKDSCRIFNAVYIEGQKYDIEGLSGMNTMRYILSLYGLNYPAVKDPITKDSPDCLKGIIPNPR